MHSINVYAASGRFFHLAFAAFFAILLRCFAVRLSALALPPFDAPSADRATAAGFFTRSGSTFGLSHFSPMMFSITALANSTGSAGALFGFFDLLARVGMVRLWHGILPLAPSEYFQQEKDFRQHCENKDSICLSILTGQDDSQRIRCCISRQMVSYLGILRIRVRGTRVIGLRWRVYCRIH